MRPCAFQCGVFAGKFGKLRSCSPLSSAAFRSGGRDCRSLVARPAAHWPARHGLCVGWSSRPSRRGKPVRYPSAGQRRVADAARPGRSRISRTGCVRKPDASYRCGRAGWKADLPGAPGGCGGSGRLRFVWLTVSWSPILAAFVRSVKSLSPRPSIRIDLAARLRSVPGDQ